MEGYLLQQELHAPTTLDMVSLPIKREMASDQISHSSATTPRQAYRGEAIKPNKMQLQNLYRRHAHSEL